MRVVLIIMDSLGIGGAPDVCKFAHAREKISPLLMRGKHLIPGKNLGHRNTFADIGQTIANYLDVSTMEHGEAMF